MATRPRSPDFLKESSAHTLRAGDMEAVFLPDHGMLGASLRYQGMEILQARGRSRSCRSKREQRGNPASLSVGEPAF